MCATKAKAKKKPYGERLRQRMLGFAQNHTGLAAACIAVSVAVIFAAVTWFVLFSGISSSADFIYASF